MTLSVNFFKNYTTQVDGNVVEVTLGNGDSTDWMSSTYAALQDALMAIGEYDVFERIFTTYEDLESLPKDEFEEFQNTLSPTACVELFEEKDILKKIETHQPDVLHYFTFLMNKWKEGYTIVFTQ